MDQLFELTGEYNSPIVKAQVITLPYDEILFIDGDTLVVGPVDTLFDTLAAFDLAAAHEPTRGWDYQTLAPAAFCELNTGVMAIKKSPKTEAFFADWQRRYDQMRAAQGLKNDQPAFRESLWCDPSIRVATLPSEFNFVCIQPNYIAWEPTIIHGRNDPTAVAKDLAQVTGPRIFHPLLGAIGGLGGRATQFFGALRVLRRSLRHLIRLPKGWTRPTTWEK